MYKTLENYNNTKQIIFKNSNYDDMEIEYFSDSKYCGGHNGKLSHVKRDQGDIKANSITQDVCQAFCDSNASCNNASYHSGTKRCMMTSDCSNERVNSNWKILSSSTDSGDACPAEANVDNCTAGNYCDAVTAAATEAAVAQKNTAESQLLSEMTALMQCRGELITSENNEASEETCKRWSNEAAVAAEVWGPWEKVGKCEFDINKEKWRRMRVVWDAKESNTIYDIEEEYRDCLGHDDSNWTTHGSNKVCIGNDNWPYPTFSVSTANNLNACKTQCINAYPNCKYIGYDDSYKECHIYSGCHTFTDYNAGTHLDLFGTSGFKNMSKLSFYQLD